MTALPPSVQQGLALPTAEQVDRLLYCGSRAPSPHNAQGFRLRWDGARITVQLDPAHRVLGALDPLGLEGELACGAVVANLETAAAGLGLCAQVSWRPDAQTLAAVSLGPGGQADEAALELIGSRAVNRGAYLPDAVSGDALAALRETARAAGFALHVLTEREPVAEVAALAARAGQLKLSHPETSRELYGLMRFSGAAAAQARDGLDVRLFDLPPGGAAVSAVAMHPVAQKLGELTGLMARLAEETPLRAAPALCLLVAPEGPDAFLHGGRAFQRVALEVARAGLALQPHSAPIEVALGALPGADEIDAGLRRAFGCAAGERPVVLFRLGKPVREPLRKSLRRAVSEPPARDEAHYAELTRRNQPALPTADQRALSGTRLLVAGCGSIGGAVVEPLARMGLMHFLLAEPGSYELNNLNRQAALLPDLGRNKAEVLRELVGKIHPAARVLVEPRGVTAGNVDWLVGSTDVIVDGVDVTEEAGLRAKVLLHEEAFRQQRVVISGLDLAGTQLVRIFDYREAGAQPFDGRLAKAPSPLTPVEFLARIIDPLDFPAEMLDYCEAAIRGTAGSAPQLAPAADLFGVLASWAVLDVACGRPLVKRVRLDVPGLLRPAPQELLSQAKRLARLAHLRILLEVKRAGF